MKPANSHNDELLKKYMKHLPKTMLEEAKNASPAPQKLSAGITGRSGNTNANKKWSRIGAVAGAAAALVICVVAGIVIAIKLPKTVKQPDDMTQLNPTVVETPTPAIDTGTTSPAPTTVVTPTREAANTPEVTNIPKVTPISTEATPTAGPTAGSTAIPAPTATTAPTATPAKATTPTATTAPTATPAKATTPTATTAPTATPTKATTPTATTAPTATPEPTPSLPFVIPSGLREFTVKVDNNLASEYPGTRPAKVSYGENGFWFETVNVVRPGTYYARSVEGGDLQTYTVNSDIYFHFEYTGEISTIDNIVSMNIDRVRVWLEFTSGSDRETLKRVVAALSQSLSSDYARKVQYGDVSTLLSGEKIVYNPKETGYLLGDLLCFSRDNVRGLAVQKNGDNVLLSYIDVASSTNIAVSSDGYNYSYSGGTLTTVKHFRGTYMISSREYSGGELIRSYERINVNSFVEYFNDKDNSRTVTTTVKGNNKVTVETYQDRADLLALITKETVSENDAKYKYTETTEYYKAAGSPETWTESQITRNVNGADWVEVVRKYDINGNPVSVVSDNSYGTHSEEIMVWNEWGVNVESRGFMTQNGEKVNETASRRNDSGVLIYSYNVWYDSRYFSEQVYNDEGVLLIDRVYDKDTGTGQWYGYARYYDESGTLIKEKTIVFENGKWIEI
ncbi:MAG: hypothetical protein J6Y21_01805 [Clostridia bacterium]|nr:hypothetical protein [Clostridia bacterium]